MLFTILNHSWNSQWCVCAYINSLPTAFREVYLLSARPGILRLLWGWGSPTGVPKEKPALFRWYCSGIQKTCKINIRKMYVNMYRRLLICISFCTRNIFKLRQQVSKDFSAIYGIHWDYNWDFFKFTLYVAHHQPANIDYMMLFRAFKSDAPVQMAYFYSSCGWQRRRDIDAINECFCFFFPVCSITH